MVTNGLQIIIFCLYEHTMRAHAANLIPITLSPFSRDSANEPPLMPHLENRLSGMWVSSQKMRHLASKKKNHSSFSAIHHYHLIARLQSDVVLSLYIIVHKRMAGEWIFFFLSGPFFPPFNLKNSQHQLCTLSFNFSRLQLNYNGCAKLCIIYHNMKRINYVCTCCVFLCLHFNTKCKFMWYLLFPQGWNFYKEQ